MVKVLPVYQIGWKIDHEIINSCINVSATRIIDTDRNYFGV